MLARGKPLFWAGLQCPCLFVGNWTKSLKRASLKIRIIFLLSPGLILRPKQQTIGRNCITQFSVVLVPGFHTGRAQGHKETPLVPKEAAIGRVSPRWWAMVLLSTLLLAAWLMIYLCSFPTGLSSCAMTGILASGVWQGEDTFVFPVGSCWSYTSGVFSWCLTLELLSRNGNISDIIKLNRWSGSSSLCSLGLCHSVASPALGFFLPWFLRGKGLFYGSLFRASTRTPCYKSCDYWYADSQWILPTILILSKPSWRNNTHQLSWHRNMEMLVGGNCVKCSELILNNHQDSHTWMLLCAFFP